MEINRSDRYAVIVRLAEKMPAGTPLGRTALMKLVYFLQTVKSVPLGYRFSLYTYGPFDAEVLADLEQVQQRQGVESKTVLYSGGYGYEITPGDKAERIRQQADDFVKKYDASIHAVVDEFRSYTPAMLELASTLMFASREASGNMQKEELIQRVHQIKPRFSIAQIAEQWESLKQKGYLS